MSTGKFIVFEGQDGAGKSTQMRMASAYLVAAGVPHICVRDPGGSQLGERVRDLLVSEKHKDTPICTWAEFLLFSASRAQLIDEIILPALEAGKTVLCDRWALSTLAYQGAGGEDIARLVTTLEFFNLQEPDLQLVYLVPDAVAQARMLARGDKPDRFESRTEAFRRIVRRTYDNCLGFLKHGTGKNHTYRVAADLSAEEVFEASTKPLIQEVLNLSV